MKNDFDKKIRDLLEGSIPADAGFELDRNAVWSRIESKQRTKIIPFKKWMSHAAALVIGILICLPFLFRFEKKENLEVTIIKNAPASIRVIRDTVMIIQKHNSIAIAPTKLNNKKHVAQTHETITPKVLKPDLPEKTKEIYLPKEPLIELIASGKNIPRPAVLHLMDIENENTNPNKSHKKEFALFKKITVGNNSDEQSETITMTFSKQIRQTNN